MAGPVWILLFALMVCLLVLSAIWRPIHRAWRKARFAEARRDFHRQRERLEAKFVMLGMSSTRPAGLRWVDCDFDDDVAYARSRTTGELSAFVAVTIALDDGDEDPLGPIDELAGLRAATAVFRFDGRHWETEGQAIFNLSPTEAIHLYQRDLEMVGREVAQRQ
jgi:hypothetical protein